MGTHASFTADDLRLIERDYTTLERLWSRTATPETIIEKERHIRAISQAMDHPEPDSEPWRRGLRSAVEALDTIEPRGDHGRQNGRAWLTSLIALPVFSRSTMSRSGPRGSAASALSGTVRT